MLSFKSNLKLADRSSQLCWHMV